MPKLVKNWDELVGLESENYVLDINVHMGCGWIRDKHTNESVTYLSTHTFYGSKYRFSTELLNKYGFDVELVNWDNLSTIN